MACCSQGICAHLEMWRQKQCWEAEQQVWARDELERQQHSTQSGTRWGWKQVGTPCFEDDRKPGNVELLGMKLLLAEGTDGHRKGQTDSDPSPSDQLSCPINSLLLLEQNQGPQQHRTHFMFTSKHCNTFLGCRQASNTEISTERDHWKVGSATTWELEFKHMLQREFPSPTQRPPIGLKPVLGLCCLTYKPIKGVRNLSIAFSKPQNRFSGLTRGIPCIKGRAVQDWIAMQLE